MAGGYADPRKMPADLIGIFDKSGRNANFHYAERKVLAGWRSWSHARERYSKVKAPVTLVYGDSDWSRIPERARTKELLGNSHFFTLKNSGHFSSVENPQDAGGRYRTVGLRQVEPVSRESADTRVGEPLEEHPSAVGVQLRRELPRPWNAEFADAHWQRLS